MDGPLWIRASFGLNCALGWLDAWGIVFGINGCLGMLLGSDLCCRLCARPIICLRLVGCFLLLLFYPLSLI